MVNASPFLVPNAFAPASPGAALAADGQPALAYLPLWLQDCPGEDLTSRLPAFLDWVTAAHAAGGCVLVHCSQGVSRSVALCCAWLMWRDGLSYEAASARLKAVRAVASPNMGFACQLMLWAKRRAAPPLSGEPRVYRIAPHSTADPRALVARPVLAKPPFAALDARTALLVHSADALHLWRGPACPTALAEAAEVAATHLVRYKNAPWPPMRCVGGAEPAALLDALGAPPEARREGADGLRRPEALMCDAVDEEAATFAAGRRSLLAQSGGVGAQELAAALSQATALQDRRPRPPAAPRPSLPAVHFPAPTPRWHVTAAQFSSLKLDAEAAAPKEEDSMLSLAGCGEPSPLRLPGGSFSAGNEMEI